MKKLLYASLILLSLSQTSCTMMVKGLVKAVVKGYDNYTDMNVSSFQLADQQGKKHTFSSLYAGKTVYFISGQLYQTGLPEKKTRTMPL